MTLRFDRMDEFGIPEYMQNGIKRYYENGIPPGSFLSAVIDNDLKSACARADDTNSQLLHNYVKWFYNCAPGGTWGYAGAVKTYCENFRAEATA